MKKLVLLVVFALIGYGASAQFSWGVKGGLNVTSVSNFKSDIVDRWNENRPENFNQVKFRNKVSFHAGFFAHYQFTKVIGLQTELLYSRQGCDSKWENNHFGEGPDRPMFKSVSNSAVDQELWTDIKNRRRTYKNDYLNVPLFVTISPVQWMSVDLGAQLGISLYARYVTTICLEDNEGYESTGIDSYHPREWYGERHNLLDLSAVMGLTFKITPKILCSARYNLGLTPITKHKALFGNQENFDDPEGHVPSDAKFYNRVLQISVGYAF